MSTAEQKLTKNRLRSSYLSVIISISLVLFMLGTFGALLLNASQIARYVKENFAVTVILENEASLVAVRQFQKSLQLAEYVKSTEFISREEAAEELKAELDEEFMDFLGYNPLNNSIEVRLNAEYVTEAKISELENEFTGKPFVKEVVYDKPLIQKMNENIRNISLFLIVGSVLLSLVAIALINSSIRLAIYSRRFLIKTMQLVGATKSFIRKPFIYRSLRHGLYGSVVACLLLGLVFFYIEQNIPGFASLQSFLNYIILGFSIFAAGILISMSCTFFALKKYLKLKTDQLYF
jgi:cell division transport system permease protein